jgi:excisionase family DNA binding protein
MTPAQAAALLGLDAVYAVPERAVLQLVRRHELVGVRVGRRVMITPESVDAIRYGG